MSLSDIKTHRQGQTFFFLNHPEFLAPILLQGLSHLNYSQNLVQTCQHLLPFKAMVMKSTDIYNTHGKKNRYHIAIAAGEVHFVVARPI